MSKKTKTRAEVMAAQYGPKLQELGIILVEKKTHKLPNEQTIGQKEKLKKAVAKLRTFYD